MWGKEKYKSQPLLLGSLHYLLVKKVKCIISKMAQMICTFIGDACDVDICVSMGLSNLFCMMLSITGSGYACTVGKASMQKGYIEKEGNALWEIN